MKSIEVTRHGRFSFDPEVFEEVWNEHRENTEWYLRALVADMAYDSIRDVEQTLSRFELIGMLAEFETNARKERGEL